MEASTLRKYKKKSKLNPKQAEKKLMMVRAEICGLGNRKTI